MAVEGTRIREGIRAFLDECTRAGKSQEMAHCLFVNGQDVRGVRLAVRDHLRRGAMLSRLTDAWLATWGE